MSEVCSARVRDSALLYRILVPCITGQHQRLRHAVVKELFNRAIFTLFWWSMSLLYSVGRPTCYHILTSTSREETEAKFMGWMEEVFLAALTSKISDVLVARITGKQLWQYLDIILEDVRKITWLITVILQLLINFTFFCYTNCITEPWNTLWGCKNPRPVAKAYYTYKKLQKEQIRLLRLHRDRGFKIRYELVEIPIHDAPSFEAISYTWGDPLAVEDITISDNTFRTTRTVANILRSRCHKLRLFPLPGTEFFMWVDALCINQEDKDEKNHQIPLMRKIYSSATRVIVWLGDRSCDREAGWLLLELCLSPEEAIYNFLLGRKTPTMFPWGPASSVPLEWKPWLGLGRLMSHPWFTRIWVVQEVSVAREVLVIYGDGMLSWDVVHWIMKRLLRHGITAPIQSPISSIGFSPGVKAQYIDWARSLIHTQKTWTLRKAMIRFSHSKATDPRDKVFALLGLVTDDLDIEEWIDYNKTSEQVYRKTATYLLARKEDGLDLLSLAGIGHARRLNELPSWVPDWSNPPLGLGIILESILNHIQYNASKGRKCDKEILLDLDPDSIRLIGAKVDKVKVIAKAQTYLEASQDKEIGDISQHMSLWYQECCNMEEKYSPDPYMTSQPREEAFWRALIGDRAMQSRPAPSAFASDYQSSRRLFLNPSLDLTDSDFRHYIEFDNALSPMAYGRRFCITESGYMGWVPPYTESGDLVCIFDGGCTPFLLRNEIRNEVEQVYRLVGECFFHGMMDGEMSSGDDQAKEFIVY